MRSRSTTAFVATVGGHITELVELAARLPAGDEVWITSDTPQTRDLLDGRTVEWVPFIGERDLLGVARAMPAARSILRRHDVGRVVSTGSAIALAYLPVAAVTGRHAHYIESSTRVESCSMTGRLLSRTPGVRCWWQYESAPDRFTHLAGVYDRYVAVERTDLATSGSGSASGPGSSGAGLRPGQGPTVRPEVPIARVVVTVGTTDRCFRRLITRLIDILPSDAEVLWQTGHSDVDDLPIDGKRLVPEAELVAAIAKADVVVSHAGAGSLALVLAAGKVPVFVPRRASAGEQIDDHQVELARWADAAGLAVTAEADRIELTDLRRAAALRVVRNQPQELALP